MGWIWNSGCSWIDGALMDDGDDGTAGEPGAEEAGPVGPEGFAAAGVVVGASDPTAVAAAAAARGS